MGRRDCWTSGARWWRKGVDGKLFSPSGLYEEVKEGGRFFLTFRERGGRVETDRWTHEILRLLPGTTESLREAFLSEGLFFSRERLNQYLLLLERAAVLRSDSPPERVRTAGPPVRGEVEVVIVSYRGQEYLRRNLTSLQEQSHLPKRIVVVDNASGDGTPQWLSREFPAAEVLSLKRNLHYAGGVNRGVAMTTTPWVLILNQDIELERGAVEELLRRAEGEEDVGAVVPQMRLWKAPFFLNGLGNVMGLGDWGADQWQGYVDGPWIRQEREVGSACFGAVLVSREAWERVGPLDKQFKSYYEDMDWSLRARKEGLRLLAAPEAVVYHRFGGSYMGDRKLCFVVRNRLLSLWKSFSPGAAKQYTLAALKHGLRLLYQARGSGTFMALLWAHCSAFMNLPRILLFRLRRGGMTEAQTADYLRRVTPLRRLINKEGDPQLSLSALRSFYGDYDFGELGKNRVDEQQKGPIL